MYDRKQLTAVTTGIQLWLWTRESAGLLCSSSELVDVQKTFVNAFYENNFKTFQTRARGLRPRIVRLAAPSWNILVKNPEVNCVKFVNFDGFCSQNLLAMSDANCFNSTLQGFAPGPSYCTVYLSLIHIWRCRRIERCRSRWSPYH